jgi:hypothetical protein
MSESSEQSDNEEGKEKGGRCLLVGTRAIKDKVDGDDEEPGGVLGGGYGSNEVGSPTLSPSYGDAAVPQIDLSALKRTLVKVVSPSKSSPSSLLPTSKGPRTSPMLAHGGLELSGGHTQLEQEQQEKPGQQSEQPQRHTRRLPHAQRDDVDEQEEQDGRYGDHGLGEQEDNEGEEEEHNRYAATAAAEEASCSPSSHPSFSDFSSATSRTRSAAAAARASAAGEEQRLQGGYFGAVSLQEALGSFDLRVVFRHNRTGFEDSKDFRGEAGTVVAGRYRIEETLGTAAFSTALQCVDLETVPCHRGGLLDVTPEEEAAAALAEGGDEGGMLEPLLVCLKVIKNNKDFFDQSLDEIKLLHYINSAGDPDDHHVLHMYVPLRMN